MDLAPVREADAQRRLKQFSVALHRRRVVVGQAPQVEALVRTPGKSPVARREQGAGARQLDQDVRLECLGRAHRVSSSSSGTGVRWAYSKCAWPSDTSVLRCAQPPT